MKRLIVADIKSFNNEGRSTGHYFAVAQNYLENFSRIYKVLVAGGPIYNTKFKKENLFQLPCETNTINGRAKNKWKFLRNSIFLFKNTSPNDIIVMQKCGIITTFIAIVLFAKKRRNNIFMIEYDTTALNSKFKRIIYSIAKKKIRGFICPNETVGTSYNLPYCIVTDYIYSKLKQTVTPSFKDKIYDFCIVGSIWPDKGVVEVAEKLKDSKYKLIIAGKPCNERIKNQLELLSKDSPNITLNLGYISDEDYTNYIINSKYCILNYQGCYNERSSGVILDVLFMNVPVLAHRCKATSFVEKENAGFLYNDLDEINIDEILSERFYNTYIEGIKKFISKQKLYKENLIRFFETHS